VSATLRWDVTSWSQAIQRFADRLHNSFYSKYSVFWLVEPDTWSSCNDAANQVAQIACCASRLPKQFKAVKMLNIGTVSSCNNAAPLTSSPSMHFRSWLFEQIVKWAAHRWTDLLEPFSDDGVIVIAFETIGNTNSCSHQPWKRIFQASSRAAFHW
jgi:hypothetical protein